MKKQRPGRFTFVFTSKHGSWLNLLEGLFSKVARSVLCQIHVDSKAELKSRLLAHIGQINRSPAIHRWNFRINAPSLAPPN